MQTFVDVFGSPGGAPNDSWDVGVLDGRGELSECFRGGEERHVVVEEDEAGEVVPGATIEELEQVFSIFYVLHGYMRMERHKGFYKGIPIVVVVLGQKDVWRYFFH